jgi:hypothetical protein
MNTTVFDPSSEQNFETLSHQNGQVYWLASDFAKWLGYTEEKSFLNAVNKAIGVCTTPGISVADNFKQFTHTEVKNSWSWISQKHKPFYSTELPPAFPGCPADRILSLLPAGSVHLLDRQCVRFVKLTLLLCTIT